MQLPGPCAPNSRAVPCGQRARSAQRAAPSRRHSARSRAAAPSAPSGHAHSGVASRHAAHAGDRPCIAITAGDPAGIGAEVLLRALGEPRVASLAGYTIYGCRQHLASTHDRLVAADAQAGRPPALIADPAALDVRDMPLPAPILPGVEGAAGGRASFAWLDAAITATLDGRHEAVVTGPISKAAWAAAGHAWPGQTEVLAARSGVRHFGMAFAATSPHTGWQLRALLATTHIPLAQVPAALDRQLLAAKLDLLVAALRDDFGVERPRIAVAGLNPHAGEAGQLGREEVSWLAPWLEAERAARPGVTLEGPLPPDTMWLPAGAAWWGGGGGSGGEAGAAGGLPGLGAGGPVPQSAPDAFLALYHDQGLIPVKVLAFDTAVNVTLGLPFVRTSPDHGTAFGIAGRGVADAGSMWAAIELAVQLCGARRAGKAKAQ